LSEVIDFDVYVLAYKFFVAFEDDDFALRVSADELFLATSRSFFHEDFKSFVQVSLVAQERVFVLEFDYFLKAAQFYVFWDVVWVISGCVCIGSDRVFEHISVVELYLLH